MDAIAQIERTLGFHLPYDYADFLRSHRAEDQPGMFVASNPDYWGVRKLFDSHNEPPYSSVLEVLRLTGDVIPQNAIPVAEDWSGNMYLLLCDGPNRGHVVWWNHEREFGDLSVEHVADTFSEFKGLLRYESL
jgi:hypothetical protein